MGDDPGTVGAAVGQAGQAGQAVSEEAFFFDADGQRLPTADGAVRGEIVEHLPDGRTRSTLFEVDGRSAA